jgi:TrmH family RNA methyltransferase
MIITSRSNPKIKLIKNLRDRKVRKETGLFYIEGIKPVGDALSSGWDIKSIIIAPGLLKSDFAQELIKKSEALNLEIISTDKEVFESISDKDGPQGIGAVVHCQTVTLDCVNEMGGIWVGLDSVQDPGNLGTILRTIDSSGARGIILIGSSADPFSIEAVRSSMGAIFSVKIITTAIEKFLLWKAKSETILVGTSDKAGLDFRDARYQEDMILLMGSEQKGLNPALMDACSTMVSIPMRGKSDSLNLAVATGIILYEITAQLEDDEPANGGRI